MTTEKACEDIREAIDMAAEQLSRAEYGALLDWLSAEVTTRWDCYNEEESRE